MVAEKPSIALAIAKVLS